MAASPLQEHPSGRLLIQRKSSRIIAPGGTSVQPQAGSCATEPARCPTLPVSRHRFGLPNETSDASRPSGATVTLSACGLNLRNACLNEHRTYYPASGFEVRESALRLLESQPGN